MYGPCGHVAPTWQRGLRVTVWRYEPTRRPRDHVASSNPGDVMWPRNVHMTTWGPRRHISSTWPPVVH
eukprot:8431078-Karenia_brevis.AAC.1